MAAVLSVRNLRTEFRMRSANVVAVDDVTFEISEGECVGLVGESGCGKTTIGLSIMRLLQNNGHVIGGSIEHVGKDLAALSEEEMQKVRGNEIAFIPQDPMTSLNPTMNIGRQIAEGYIQHRGVSPEEGRERALEVLRLVEMPRPEERLSQFPHELSGGLRQRVIIAMALVCEPQLLIADEPTTALDVTVQAQILALVRALQARSGSAVILITHDLGVVAELADRVIIMYAGRKVEEATTSAIFFSARHPYTKGLLGAVPRISGPDEGSRTRLTEIPGTAPGAGAAPTGCAFAPRCPCAVAVCTEFAPVLTRSADGHEVACHRAPVFAA
jgi:peptide/nickel transport system ATP-binding protein